jgi:hypothetical protein
MCRFSWRGVDDAGPVRPTKPVFPPIFRSLACPFSTKAIYVDVSIRATSSRLHIIFPMLISVSIPLDYSSRMQPGVF